MRQSGDIDGTPRIRLHGPAGAYDTTGLMVAARHIHMSADDARAWALADGDMVDVSLDQTARGLTFTMCGAGVGQGLDRVDIDTDEANAAGIVGAVDGEIMGAMSPSRHDMPKRWRCPSRFRDRPVIDQCTAIFGPNCPVSRPRQAAQALGEMQI